MKDRTPLTYQVSLTSQRVVETDAGCTGLVLSLPAVLGLGEVLVEHVLSQATADAFEVGDVVTDLLDGAHLLLQVLTLDEVSHLKSETKTQIHDVVCE